MRRVTLRWNLSSLQGSKEISNILNIVESIEVLSHLSVTSDGVLEEESDYVVVSLLCTHSFAKSAIELSNIQVYPPYGIDSVRGMEIRMSGLSDSVRRFVSILRVVLPPDKISVNSIRDPERNGWTDGLTKKQKEVISYAIGRGYFEPDSKIKLKDIAEGLGMARSTLGEHMKRAEYEIMKKVAEDLD